MEEEEQRKQLCAEVRMDAHNLTLEQRDQLMTVTDYADIFAIGPTQLVQNHIDHPLFGSMLDESPMHWDPRFKR